MENRVVTWPMPHTEMRSDHYSLSAGGVEVPVWLARVREAINRLDGNSWSCMLGGPTEWASFARFNAEYPVEVTVTLHHSVETVELLPASAGLQAEREGDTVRFTLDRPRHITLCINGTDEHPLHLFCREPEVAAIVEASDDLIYFGPGEHWVDTIVLKSGQSLYLDGGAILRAVLPAGATGTRGGVLNLTSYQKPVIVIANAENVRVYGRGIIDGGCLPHPAKSLIVVHNSSNVHIEGITLHNSPSWHMPIMQSRNVTIDNVACISGRLNSDGINCVGSRDVTVRNTFVRGHDDSFVVKTMNAQYPASDIVYENCTAWNDWGFAFGISYETRAAIHDIVFRDCEVIYARNWPLGIHVSDSGTIGPVLFERINIHYPKTDLPPVMERQCIRLDIVQDVWGKDSERGHIQNVSLRDISISGEDIPPLLLHGADKEHLIENVRLINVNLNGRQVTSASDEAINSNEFVQGLLFGE